MRRNRSLQVYCLRDWFFVFGYKRWHSDSPVGGFVFHEVHGHAVSTKLVDSYFLMQLRIYSKCKALVCIFQRYLFIGGAMKVFFDGKG